MLDLELLQQSLSSVAFIAGCDEVGRGPLAGPVVACSVIFEVEENSEDRLTNLFNSLSKIGVTDSKKLTKNRRRKILESLKIPIEEMRADQIFELQLEKNVRGYFSLYEIQADRIDEINILNASLLAMNESFKNCYKGQKGILLIDGNKLPVGLPELVDARAIIKGDSKSVIIGLASIMAKEYRDLHMEKMDQKYPGYGFLKHAGYPTKTHREAIKNLGVSPIHRKSFKGVKEFV